MAYLSPAGGPHPPWDLPGSLSCRNHNTWISHLSGTPEDQAVSGFSTVWQGVYTLELVIQTARRTLSGALSTEGETDLSTVAGEL